MAGQTIGYLHTNQQHGTISIAVPCDTCRTFHWHGGGTTEHPLHQPGDLTHRTSHCPNGNDYSTIRISTKPYRPPQP